MNGIGADRRQERQELEHDLNSRFWGIENLSVADVTAGVGSQVALQSTELLQFSEHPRLGFPTPPHQLAYHQHYRHQCNGKSPVTTKTQIQWPQTYFILKLIIRQLKVKKVKGSVQLFKGNPSQGYGASPANMGSHSITCQQTGRYSVYLRRRNIEG